MSDRIHQEIEIAAPPAAVYEALTTAARFTAMTGAPADIDGTAGGAFACFGGMIAGRNVELIPGERVVQAWRVKVWEPGVYSIARFTLQPVGSGDSITTRVVLDHSGFPDGQAEHLGAGWHANYWEPLRKLLA